MGNSAITGLKKRYAYVCNMIQTLEGKLNNLPEGKIQISRQFKNPIYYLVDESSSRIRLGNNDLQLIDDLIQKQYLAKVLRSASSAGDEVDEDLFDAKSDVLLRTLNTISS